MDWDRPKYNNKNKKLILGLLLGVAFALTMPLEAPTGSENLPGGVIFGASRGLQRHFRGESDPQKLAQE